MSDDQSIIKDAIEFLAQGGEQEAAELLRTCTLERWEVVDSWMDGPRQLDGILIDVCCPRKSYEILTKKNACSKSIHNAFGAVMPSGTYLKSLHARAVSSTVNLLHISNDERQKLVSALEAQKNCMINVSTGGPLIKEVSKEYSDRRLLIRRVLDSLETTDPNPYPDLWMWYQKYKDGSLPTYMSRRRYVTDLYQPLLDALQLGPKPDLIQPEPTGWTRVDRNVDKISNALERANNEEDYQTVALLCREQIISLAQAVYDPAEHGSFDGVVPSSTDAKRMLDSYIAKILSGGSHDYQRKFARAAFDLAVNLQHRRSATFRDAALCAEAARALVNIIATISGQRDPDK